MIVAVNNKFLGSITFSECSFIPFNIHGCLYSEKKKVCRTPQKGSVDLQKHPNVSKVSKKDKKFDRTFWRFCVLPSGRTISYGTFF